jgi:thiol-disulfide isomerase/thioredoxin
MLALLPALFALALGQEVTTRPLADIDSLRALWHEHLDGGQEDGSREEILAYLAESERSDAATPAFLLEESLVLSWLDEDDESVRVFERVSDADLVEPYQFLNRLQRVVDEDLERAAALVRRLGARDPDALTEWIHDSYAQRFAPHVRNGVDIVEHRVFLARICEDDAVVRDRAGGLPTWLDVLASDRDAEGLRRALTECAAGDGGPARERYALLLVELALADERTRVDAEVALHETLGRLERSLARIGTSPPDLERRMRVRYLGSVAALRIATCCCSGDPNREAAWLLRAARIAPNAADQSVAWAAFYEHVCTGGPTDVREACAERLFALGRSADARAVRLDLVLAHPTEIAAVQARYESDFPERSFGADLLTRIDETAPVAPPFAHEALDGETIDTAKLRGRWILLEFWGTWCAPCRESLPEVEALHREFARPEDSPHEDGAPLVLTVACRDTNDAVRRFMAEQGYTFAVVLDDETVAAAYGVRGYPTRILVTPSGRCVELPFAESAWADTVRRFVELRR